MCEPNLLLQLAPVVIGEVTKGATKRRRAPVPAQPKAPKVEITRDKSSANAQTDRLSNSKLGAAERGSKSTLLGV